ncbi:unnamed protein product [Pleuronectes platessa]|uniref:Uncharacterized protein n=1 Tax=Pleuronectes platessa TaxID=8262 RepID=A0A9N7Z8A6_PLEPL|nr:unnamed protein product [Pleuronectes platessa]
MLQDSQLITVTLRGRAPEKIGSQLERMPMRTPPAHCYYVAKTEKRKPGAFVSMCRSDAVVAAGSEECQTTTLESASESVRQYPLTVGAVVLLQRPQVRL